MKKLYSSILWLLVLSLGTQSLAAPVIPEMITYPPSHYDWTSEPLTGNDKPYELTMSKIDKELASGQPPTALWNRYHALAVLDPHNPVAQFSDAYALWVSRYQILTSSEDYYTKRMAAYRMVANEMLNARDPYAYEYSRIHLFVVLRSEGYSSPKYKDLAFDLMKKNPDDIPLKCDIISNMSYPLDIKRDGAVPVN